MRSLWEGSSILQLRNVCRRITGRGACPCKLTGRFCTKYCTCGAKKLACTNRSRQRRVSDDSSTSDEEVNVSATAVEVPSRKKVAKKQQSKRSSQSMTPHSTTNPTTESDGAANRDANLQTDITTFLGGKGEGELRELCLNLLQRHPEEWENLASQEDGDYASPAWCFCGRCREMPTEREHVCCRHNLGACVTTSLHFQSLILDPEALDLAMVQRYDLLALGDRPGNNTYRYTAYRSYIYWKAGRTGRYNHVVIPSCAFWCIRDGFPSEDGHYTGFRVGRF